MDWFEGLFGFREGAYTATQSKFVAEGGRLISRANGRSWSIGAFEMASLAELRRLAEVAGSPSGKPTVRLVQGDVRKMHAMPEYAGALFQVASQFNVLEMVSPDVVPEDGVTRYQHDRTQGPACAMAAAVALIYRNYFVPIGDHAARPGTGNSMASPTSAPHWGVQLLIYGKCGTGMPFAAAVAWMPSPLICLASARTPSTTFAAAFQSRSSEA
jgi:hypothetical protein